MTRKERMTQVLHEAFNPLFLDVIDESHQHHGHSGWREEGETHIRVKIISHIFDGESRINRHRRVNACLAPFFKEGLHALAIEANAPAETIQHE
jgi:BolA protein